MPQEALTELIFSKDRSRDSTFWSTLGQELPKRLVMRFDPSFSELRSRSPHSERLSPRPADLQPPPIAREVVRGGGCITCGVSQPPRCLLVLVAYFSTVPLRSLGPHGRRLAIGSVAHRLTAVTATGTMWRTATSVTRVSYLRSVRHMRAQR